MKFKFSVLNLLISFVLIVLFLMIGACNITAPKEGDSTKPKPYDLTQVERDVITSDNQFGLKLFRSLSASQIDRNVIISPLSISMALGMTLNGAADSTYAAMAATLEKTGLSETEINAAYRHLIDLLTQLDPEVVFQIANSIWYRQGFAIEPPFLDVNQTYFDAEVCDLDFNAPEAVDIINNWVDDKTNGKIEEIITQIDPLTMLYLINAIYFKGTWLFEFDEDYTQDNIFHNLDGSNVTVPLMVLEGTLPFLYTDTFMAVDLPYGDSLFSMTIMLPHPGEDINTLVQQIELEQWDQWTQQFIPADVLLFLPRFKLDYRVLLLDALSALGMGVAFSAQAADFSRINPDMDLYISNVIHKTFIEVNEEGTEAAAVTAVIVGTTSAGDNPPIMRVDRPFLFVIREHYSGTILFVGKVVDLST